MAFYFGTDTMPALVNMLANKLIASDSKFTDPYAAGTRYTGGDTDVDFGVSSYHRRCIKWEDPALGGQEQTMYIVLEIPFWSSTSAKFRVKNNDNYIFGIIATFSTAWDATNNVPSGSIQRAIIPVLQGTTAMTNTEKINVLSQTFSYWLYVDDVVNTEEKGNGLVIMLRPTALSWGNAASVLFNIEKLKLKDYQDGYSLWSICSQVNFWWHGNNSQSTLTKKWGWTLHPWAEHSLDEIYDEPQDMRVSAYTDHPDQYSGKSGWLWSGVKGITFPLRAELNQEGGANNAYYMNGIAHADPRFNNSPVGQIEHCFPWKKNAGIADMDILSLPSPSPVKYICLDKSSLSSATSLTMAIKYSP